MKNVILIGMPGAGKSTIGVVLAKALGYDFLDSDIVIQNRMGKTLTKIIEEVGKEGFNEIEGDVNASLNVENTVIATGGSAVYSENAMNHFKSIGKVVFLDLTLESILKRLGNIEERGISMKPGETIEDLFNERKPLYEKYADIKVQPENMSIRETMEKVKELLSM